MKINTNDRVFSENKHYLVLVIDKDGNVTFHMMPPKVYALEQVITMAKDFYAAKLRSSQPSTPRIEKLIVLSLATACEFSRHDLVEHARETDARIKKQKRYEALKARFESDSDHDEYELLRHEFNRWVP